MKTKKWKKWAAGICSLPLVVIATHFHLNTALQKKIHVENSINPAATDNFSHAALVAHYVKIIHDRFFVDCDSVLFKPFYNLESSFFKKGQQGIKPGNLGEEAVWWYLINSERMAFAAQGRKDSYVYRPGSGADTIINGDGGTDWLIFTDARLTYVQSGEDLQVRIDGSTLLIYSLCLGIDRQ
ncbi:hypothetical protein [Desulfobacter curvatus]|uniref:hypothetical protein n=1 Tax=Desulfobacter curvatus TaxID=2290 RepID=UPI00037A9185|nr:hypothetical protein [Desulfobacter curvatus]